MSDRYVLMSPEQAKAAGIADPPYSDWDEEIEYDNDGSYRLFVVDTVAKTVVGSDGGEPEDQTLVRDWAWVVGALNEAYQCGRDDEYARHFGGGTSD